MVENLLFQCDGRGYGFTEVISAADFRGELAPVRRYLRESLAALAFAEARGDAVSDAMLQQVSEQYRQERGLATSAATKAWLSALGLDGDDFADFLERRIVHGRFTQDLPAIARDNPPSNADIESAVRGEVLFTGLYRELAAWLARRVALPAEDVPSIAGERERFLARSGLTLDDLPAWSARQGCAPSWLDELLLMEARYRRKRTELLTPENFSNEMRARRQALMCVEVEALVFSDEEAAREAYLCVVEDGESLDEVSARAPGRRFHTSVFLERLSEEKQLQFLSAPPGHTFPPAKEEGGYVIHHVRRKIEPALEDDAVRQRLEHALITRYFDELAASRIVWVP